MCKQGKTRSAHLARLAIFAIRITAEERRLITLLAQREERTASDTIRRLIRQAVQKDERAPASKH